MIKPLTREEGLIIAMKALYLRTHQPDCADKFRAVAKWWRLHARMSASPEEAMRHSANQDALADDMEARPRHYAAKPVGYSCYQWSKCK